MVWIISFFTLAGFNFIVWVLIGVFRFFFEYVWGVGKSPVLQKSKISPEDVAAIVPAHNEEVSIKRTIEALLRVLPARNIYVVSDDSTDKTIDIVRSTGVRSLDLRPNRGKARSLVWVMREYKLLEAYQLIIINDADSEIDKDYVKNALPHFNDESIACIAPYGRMKDRNYTLKEMFFIAYRMRLWRVLQLPVRFGQTWKFTNVSYIVPGSLSMYRTRVLAKLDIDAPGLIIEDFNMTFELHKKRLGKIAYDTKVFGYHQDPYTFRDYVKQVRRWSLGFWQTVKRNGVWPSLFWLATGSFITELTAYALFVLFTPFLLILFFYNNFQPLMIPLIYERLTVIDILLGVFLADYIVSLVVAIIEKKPLIILYGFGFFFLRYIDAFIHLYAIPMAFLTESSGVWSSPRRK